MNFCVSFFALNLTSFPYFFRNLSFLLSRLLFGENLPRKFPRNSREINRFLREFVSSNPAKFHFLFLMNFLACKVTFKIIFNVSCILNKLATKIYDLATKFFPLHVVASWLLSKKVNFEPCNAISITTIKATTFVMTLFNSTYI